MNLWTAAGAGLPCQAAVWAATRGSPQGLAALQRERLVALLRAAQRAPWWRERLAVLPPGWEGLDLAALLAALPVLHKPALMAHFDATLTEPGLRLAEARAWVADPANIGAAWQGRFILWESSGTSGVPALFVQDAHAMAVYDALETQRRDEPRPFARWADPWRLAERHAFVGAIDGHFASEVSMARLRRLHPWCAGRLRSFSILQALPALVAALDDYAPTVIATYPTAAVLLAGEARAGRLRCRPAEVWTGGEHLSAAMRASIAEAFGCAVRASYGASEFLSMGWECAHGRLHLNSDWVILEPVDAQGRPVPPGVPSHTTLLTNLANHVQPLIRCDLGDQVCVAAVPCPCGSALPTVEIQGRRDEVLRVPGRSGGTVDLLPLALTTVLEDEARVFDFQLVGRADGAWRLQLACDGPAGRQAAARCRRVLAAYLARMGAAPIALTIRTGLAAGKGRSGKVQRVRIRAG